MPNHIYEGQGDERQPLIPAEQQPPRFRQTLSKSSRRLSSLLLNASPRFNEDQSNIKQEELIQDLTDSGSYSRGLARNFESIDWLHDNVKDEIRRRKIRSIKGVRGVLLNLFDGAQGWVVVSLVGFLTSCIAFCIIKSERWLFDIKDGYCSADWRRSKHGCCPDAARVQKASVFVSHHLSGWAKQEVEACEHWHRWSQVFTGHSSDTTESFRINYAAYLILAVLFAIASLMTVYLTSSESVDSAKDRIESLDHNDSESDNGKARSIISMEKSLPPRKVMYFAGGSGIPEIKSILGGFVIRGYLGAWTLLVKSTGLALSVASGLSLGKEGRAFPKYNKNEVKRREVISAACAAGVAVSFGAPIGGVLFSLEETSFYFPPKAMIRSFFCAIVAAFFLQAMNPFGNGQIVLFQVSYDRSPIYIEYIGYIALGVFGGLYGACFCKLNLLWASRVRAKTWMSRHPVWEVLMIIVITTFVSSSNPFTRMGGTEAISELFTECHKELSLGGLCIQSPDLVWPLVKTLLIAIAVKAGLTVVTFGIKLPAGLFIPTLLVGALFGRILGLLVELTYERHPTWAIFATCASNEPDRMFGQACILPGVWAMIGAAATLAGATRTTVSLAVIMFELTQTLNYVVPVMLAVLVARVVADSIEPSSIYDLVLNFAQLPYLDAKQEVVHCAGVVDIVDMNAPVIDLSAENTMSMLKRKLRETEQTIAAQGFAIIKPNQHSPETKTLVGYISSKDLAVALAKKSQYDGSTPVTFDRPQGNAYNWAMTPAGCDFGHLVNMSPVTASIHSPMEVVMELFVKLGIKQLIILDQDYAYKGVIEKERWLGYLQYAEKQHHKHGHADPQTPSHHWLNHT